MGRKSGLFDFFGDEEEKEKKERRFVRRTTERNASFI